MKREREAAITTELARGRDCHIDAARLRKGRLGQIGPSAKPRR